LVSPGALLADRYIIEDLLAQDGPSESWRARDQMLSRSVVLVVVPSTSPYATEMLDAAKRAARITDTRILQVLDAVNDGELSYVVREWANGQSLDIVLGEGPLAARRATWMMREVAAAMSNAHRQGIPHRRLAPDNIVVTKSSGVKLIGLGTAAALRGESLHDESPELEDTLDLGRLLYACLTARWPGGDVAGLPAAPTEHGRLLRPRQVRAGVPRSLDAICDRILGQQSRYGPPITTVAEVKEALSEVLADESATTGVSLINSSTPASPQPLELPPALLLREGEDPPTGEQPAYNGGHPEPRSSLRRTLGWTTIAILLAAAVLLAYLVGQYATNDDAPEAGPTTGATSQQQQPAARPLQIAGAVDFDPESTDTVKEENPDLVPLAYDGDPETSWETLTYERSPALGNLKSGVGIVIDLGSVQEVSQVNLTLTGLGTNVELRAAPEDATEMPTGSADDYTVVAEREREGTEAQLRPSEPVSTQFLLVWLTWLPQVEPGEYRGGIAEIEVLGG
jgi:putative peptidoglycan lipid II flippase